VNKRSEILRKAESLVNGDRNVQYGDPRSDFRRTATLWEAYLNGVHERHMHVGMPSDVIFLDEHDVAVLMILLKVSRIAWSPEKEDSWADLAGYAACGWDVAADPDDDLDYDDDFQNDITVDAQDVSATEEMYRAILSEILATPPPGSEGGFGRNQGFLGASLFPKGNT
jgi:hypothetical protein